METIQVIQGVLRLSEGDRSGTSIAAKWENAHVHNVLEYDEGSPLGFGLIAYSYLTNAAISSEQVIQVVSGNLVIQVFHKQDPVSARWEFGLKEATLEKKLSSLNLNLPPAGMTWWSC
jgi:hypothetical protein